MTQLKEILQELATELQATPPTLDANRVYQLLITQSILVEFHQLDPGVLIQAKLGEPPKRKREDLFMILNSANLLGKGTAGAVISLSPDEKYLTLSLALPYELKLGTLKDNLEDFVNYFIYWQGEVERIKIESERLI